VPPVTFTSDFRPFRLLYLGAICLIAVHWFGYGAAGLVVASTLDARWRS